MPIVPFRKKITTLSFNSFQCSSLKTSYKNTFYMNSSHCGVTQLKVQRYCTPSKNSTTNASNDIKNEFTSGLNKQGLQPKYNTDIIKEIISSSDVVLFMKGTPEYPQCGFSKKAVNILSLFPIKDMIAIDILEDISLRQALKDFSTWPTIPQIFIKEEFIGGCDILLELYANGELKKKLEEKGLLQTTDS